MFLYHKDSWTSFALKCLHKNNVQLNTQNKSGRYKHGKKWKSHSQNLGEDGKLNQETIMRL